MIKNWKKFNEDVYWEKEKEKPNHEKILTEFTEKYVDYHVGLESADYSVYNKFDDIYHITVFRNRDLDKQPGRPTSEPNDSMKEEWRQMAEDMVDELSRINYNFRVQSVRNDGYTVSND